jgi:hypothetical protein
MDAECDWCGDTPVMLKIDGDDLCHKCCNKWAHGEAIYAFERARELKDHACD